MVVLTFLLALGGLALALRGPAIRPGGPVSPGAIISKGQPIDAGVQQSVGFLLTNEGKKPANIERVRILGVTGPVQVLGVLAALHKGDRGSLLMLPGFPPPEYPSKPLADEHVVPVPATFSDDGSPNEGLQLVVGIQGTGDGFGRIGGIEVTYRVGKQRYRISNSGYGMLCIPQKRFYNADPNVRVEECPGEGAETFDKKFVDFRVPSEGDESMKPVPPS
jgi:hypothetical protein